MKNYEYNITCMAAGIGSRFGTESNSWSRLVLQIISSWITRFMMQLVSFNHVVFIISKDIRKVQRGDR